jgi:hypothetical protein
MKRPTTLSETIWCMTAALACCLTFIASFTLGGRLVRPDRWHAPTVHAQAGDPPEFPTHVDGHHLVQAWSPVPTRTYTGGQWAPAYGPDPATFLRFPTTVGDCGQTTFLYRWHVIGGARVRATIVYGWADAAITLAPIPADPASDVTSAAGWAVTDGCRTPVFASTDTRGRATHDVVMDVQQWTRNT